MIAQWLAADFGRGEKLILTVTTAKLNILVGEGLLAGRLSQTGTYKELIFDIASHSYTAKSFGKFKNTFIRIMKSLVALKISQQLLFRPYLA